MGVGEGVFVLLSWGANNHIHSTVKGEYCTSKTGMAKQAVEGRVGLANSRIRGFDVERTMGG